MRQGLVARKITWISGRPFVVALLVLLVFGVAIFASACGDESTASSTAGEGGTAGEKAGEGGSLLVATAASLKAAFTEMGAAFDQVNGSSTTFTFDASGVLQKQIEAGAPVDVFVSAAPTQVNALLEKGLVDEASIVTFASNEMVLAVPADSSLDIAGFEDLVDDEVERVTTADPQTAPQGKAAIEVLTSLGLLDAVQSKLIYAKNASQTLTYVTQGEVDAGIMFVTDAVGAGDAVRIVQTSDPAWHGEIAYVMALVSASEAKTLGEKFVAFVNGPEGRGILEKHGFELP